MLLPAVIAPVLISAALLAQPCTADSSATDHLVANHLVDDAAPYNRRAVGIDEQDIVRLNTLEARAVVSCSATTDCTKAAYSIPANSHYACNKARKLCTYGCNSGYVASGSKCVKSGTTSTSTGPKAPAATPVLKRDIRGSGFFNFFHFWSKPDPTHGLVTYVTADVAKSKKLVSVTSSGTAVIQIDRTSKLAVGAPRNSVRIESNEVFQPGHLILLDMKHAPVGPSVWPAFWMYNYPWPQSGEIDIFEGVNSRTFGQYTLHTTAGCTRNTNIKVTGDTSGVDNNCNAGSASLGCTIFDRDPTSYGAGFNQAGGGVFAVLFAETGISIWRWQRSKIPSDVKNGAPRWKTWGTPVAAWDGSTCDTRTFFKNQQLTFDITTCGDWAGSQGVWQDPAQSGPVYPKYKTCAAANADPAAFKEAYFEVNYLRVYTV